MHVGPEYGMSQTSITDGLREGVKYYFADFVRKGGTDFFLAKKELLIFLLKNA